MTTATTGNTLRDKAGVRWAVLVMISLTMLFAYMFVDVLSPLKTQLDQVLGWSSTVFGTYAGSEFFINVFLFFLIFAGVILDKMGVRFTAILSGSLMVIGAGLKVYALSGAFNAGAFPFGLLQGWFPSFPPSAALACAGFAIFGMGTEMAGVTVSRAIVKWFTGYELAMAMGIEMAVARLGVFAVFQSSPRINQWMVDKMGVSSGLEALKTIQTPVLFVFILLCVGLFLYLVYGVLDKQLEKQVAAETLEGEEEEPFRFKDLGKVFGSSAFWLVALLCVLYYSAIFPFQKYASSMLESNLGISNTTASSIFSLFPIGAMIITPFLGFFLDRKGKGATMLIIGSVLMIACHSIFALYPFDNSTSSFAVAISAIVLLGISFSLVPAALWPSVPKLIDNKVLGSAYSAIFWVQNIGLMAVPMLIGSVLDQTNAGVPAGEPLNFTPAMLIFASFGVFALILSLYLKVVDRKKSYGLELPNIK